MTVTPIFDDLTAHDGAAADDPEVAADRRTVGGGIVVTPGRRPTPVPRPGPGPEDATVFGQGCLDEAGPPPDDEAGCTVDEAGCTVDEAVPTGDGPVAAPGSVPPADSTPPDALSWSPAPPPPPCRCDSQRQGSRETTEARDKAGRPTGPGEVSGCGAQGCREHDALVRLVEAARREVAVLGHGRVGTEHLLLAVVRAGGEAGRAFGLRRAGAAVIAAACADGPVPGGLVAPDGAAGLSVAATAALRRARRRGAAHGRPCRPTDLALGLLDAGRSASLLTALGVDRDDLADVLAREDLELPVAAPVCADVRPSVPAPTPVGTVAPVALMLPGAPPAPDATAPLRIGPPPGSPARRWPSAS